MGSLVFDLVQPERCAGAIEIYDNAFNNCDEILALIYAKGEGVWSRARVGATDVIGVESKTRTNDMAFIEFLSLTNPVPVYEFGQRLYRYLDSYGKRYQVAFSKIEAACMNRYEINQEYKAHADDGPGHDRVISALVYMNDVPEGGETYFPLFDVSVEPKQGRLVIFPSNYAYLHEARPPSSGVKYSMAIWTTPFR